MAGTCTVSLGGHALVFGVFSNDLLLWQLHLQRTGN